VFGSEQPDWFIHRDSDLQLPERSPTPNDRKKLFGVVGKYFSKRFGGLKNPPYL
jgi:hypothetical protein